MRWQDCAPTKFPSHSRDIQRGRKKYKKHIILKNLCSSFRDYLTYVCMYTIIYKDIHSTLYIILYSIHLCHIPIQTVPFPINIDGNFKRRQLRHWKIYYPSSECEIPEDQKSKSYCHLMEKKDQHVSTPRNFLLIILFILPHCCLNAERTKGKRGNHMNMYVTYERMNWIKWNHHQPATGKKTEVKRKINEIK